jgi:hypothetical protein
MTLPLCDTPRRRVIASALVSILGLCVSATRLASQASPRVRTVTLTGVVRDSTAGEVLPNARVTIAALARAVRSNADGRFTMLGVPADTQTLRGERYQAVTGAIGATAALVAAATAWLVPHELGLQSTRERRSSWSGRFSPGCSPDSIRTRHAPPDSRTPSERREQPQPASVQGVKGAAARSPGARRLRALS